MRRCFTIPATRLLLAVGLLASPAEAQSFSDSVVVVAATLEYVLDPAHATPYLGETPYSAFHPTGDATSYCVEQSGRPGDEDDGLPRVLSAQIVSEVAGRVARWFDLEFIEDCALLAAGDDDPRGYLDESGGPALRFGVEPTFISDSEAVVHFGISSGSSVCGWICPLARNGAGTWSLSKACEYYES